MDGDLQKRKIEHELMTWQKASVVCNDKLAVLESLRDTYKGADIEILDVLIEKERDVCAQLRTQITAKITDLVALGKDE